MPWFRRRFGRSTLPPYSVLMDCPVKRAPADVDPVVVATFAIASLRGQDLYCGNLSGTLSCTVEVQRVVRKAEGALVTAGLMAASSSMRTRYLDEIVRLCHDGVRLDDVRLVRLWRYNSQ